MSPLTRRLLVVSNRLPIVLERTEEGQWSVKPGAGGLVSALTPILAERGGVWIGWPGIPIADEDDWEAALSEGHDEGYDLVPVPLTDEEVKGFYEGFSNAVLWPLFHDLLGGCHFDPSFWYCYLTANQKFAELVVENSRSDDFIWVHDYQLIHVAQFVRERAERRTGFFLHIPFPPLDIFLKLPWRAQILSALLAYDLIGLQTARDTRNLLTCLRHLVPDAEIDNDGRIAKVRLGSRTIQIGDFPIGIDYASYETSARSEEVGTHLAELRQQIGRPQVVLGIDRLDYTKGLLERMAAFRNALRRFPELREKVELVQVVVPSREGVPAYQTLKAELERLVSEINGEFSTAGWIPIHYHYRSLPRRDLISYYRMARVCFVTSIKDGMNLVAKEFVACQVEGSGVLVLSEFAGAVSQLQEGALLVNPHDIEGMADALKRAFEMDEEERTRRMDSMQAILREQDIFWWVDYYLGAALGEVPDNVRPPKEYFPPFSFEESWL